METNSRKRAEFNNMEKCIAHRTDAQRFAIHPQTGPLTVPVDSVIVELVQQSQAVFVGTALLVLAIVRLWQANAARW